MKKLDALIDDWGFDAETGKHYRRLTKRWNFLGEHLFSKYEPTAYQADAKVLFRDRLESWIGNCESDVDKKTLYELVDHLFFIGEEEFKSLYRSALSRIIVPWIARAAEISFAAPDFSRQIHRELKRTWICPITDSLRINAFYHVTRTSGRKLRPEFQVLNEFSRPECVAKFMEDSKLKRIVLLEDYSGTGDQMASAIEFTRKLYIGGNRPKVLVVPLICGQRSFRRGKALEKIDEHIAFHPVLEVPDCSVLSPDEAINSAGWRKSLHQLLVASRSKVIGPKPTSRERNLGAYGYGGSGGLVVLHTNTPNNSILLLHRQSKTWQALFPRSKR